MDNFASKLENFQSLSNLATRQEIGRNLYLNYIFARYVTSETAEEQLWWLFDDVDGQKGLLFGGFQLLDAIITELISHVTC